MGRKKKDPGTFGAKDQVGYLFGDMGGSFVNLYVDSYFLVFCTYVLGISSFYMGTLFLIARLWDAINDPLIGSLPDRHMIGKSGDRFKPYVRLIMIPLALSGVMCFTNVSGFAGIWKHIWITIAYLLYGMCYTGTSMPFGSMASVITNDPIDRVKLSRARAIGGTIVSFILALVPQFIYDDANNTVPIAFFIIAVIFGLCSILSYSIMLSSCAERTHYEVKQEDYKFAEVIKCALHNRPLLGTMIAAVGYLFYVTGFTQTCSYLFKEYYHNTSIITLASLMTLPVILILLPLVPVLAGKFGKIKTILFPVAAGLILSIVLFLVPIANPFLYMLLCTLGIAGILTYNLNCWSIVTDCIEYHEWKFGQRANGTIYSVYTFARKIGSALASAFASYSLGFVGYISGIESQTAQVAVRIRYLVTAVPVIANLLVLIGLGIVYNLKKGEMEKIHEEILAAHTQEGNE